MSPKISIVIPVYNGENFLKEAIDSALAQTYDNYEIIVVNDGSVDCTEGIALSYGNKIRYYKKENGGTASALNLAIKEMEGEYFSWLSHDDVYYPQKLQVQIECLKKAGDMTLPVYGNWDTFYSSNNYIETNLPEYRFSVEQMHTSIFPVIFGLIHGCNMLIHKCHFSRVGLFDETLTTAQDYDMWFRIFRNQKLIYIEEPLIRNRVHKAQGSKQIKEFIQNCQDFQMQMIEHLSNEEIEKLFGGHYKFYFDMLMMAINNHWPDVYNKMWRLFLDENEGGKDELQFLKGRRLVLFCAGRNGRRLKKDLHLRGYDIDCFVDSDKEKWFTEVEGIKCFPPDELQMNDMIIVTKDDPYELVMNLKNKGFKELHTYSEIANSVFGSRPLKDKVIRHLSREIRKIKEIL